MDDAEHPPPASLCKSSLPELTSPQAPPNILFAMSPTPTQTTTAAHCSTCEHVVHDLAQGVAASVKVATTTSYAEWLEQSPVDISTAAAMPLVQAPDAIELRLGHVAAELELGAHNFQVNWNSKRDNYITIDGKVFYTVQFHFHTPSTSSCASMSRLKGMLGSNFLLISQASTRSMASPEPWRCTWCTRLMTAPSPLSV